MARFMGSRKNVGVCGVPPPDPSHSIAIAIAIGFGTTVREHIMMLKLRIIFVFPRLRSCRETTGDFPYQYDTCGCIHPAEA